MFGIDASDETISFDEEPADETVVFAEDKTTLLGGDTTQEQSAQNSGIETNQAYCAAEPPRPVFEEKKPRKKDSGIQCFGWLQLGDAWYYLAPSEGNAMAVGKWEVGQDHYYFDGNGVMQTGTVDLNGANYVFGDDGRFLRREYLNGDLMDYDFVNVYGIN